LSAKVDGYSDKWGYENGDWCGLTDEQMEEFKRINEHLYDDQNETNVRILNLIIIILFFTYNNN